DQCPARVVAVLVDAIGAAVRRLGPAADGAAGVELAADTHQASGRVALAGMPAAIVLRRAGRGLRHGSRYGRRQKCRKAKCPEHRVPPSQMRGAYEAGGFIPIRSTTKPRGRTAPWRAPSVRSRAPA